ncbi:hypothetical protein LCGC14_1077390 [marine sediment metagenome]|uniref:Uncharacterized protein n=1 Tax=marine sediment metagenome TaxID=412755 RepID=A0A0F9PZI2_9ZZZZ
MKKLWLVAAMAVAGTMVGCGGSSGNNGEGETTTTPPPSTETPTPEMPSTGGESGTGFATFEAELATRTIAVSDINTGGSRFPNFGPQSACENRDYVVAGPYAIQVAFNSDSAGDIDDLKYAAKVVAAAIDDQVAKFELSGSPYTDSITETPLAVCVSTLENGGTFEQGNYLTIEAGKDTSDQYSLAIHEATHGLFKVIAGVDSNGSPGAVKYLDEGTALFAANQEFVGSGDRWRQWFDDGNVNPLTIENFGDNGVDLSSSQYFDLYPFYHTVVRYFISEDGLGLGVQGFFQLVSVGGSRNDFEAAFNARDLGITYADLQSQARDLIGDWLDARTSEVTFTWNSNPIQYVLLYKESDWRIDFDMENTGTNVFVGDANHGDDMSLDVMFATANEIYKGLSVTVVNGRIVESTVDATGAEYVGPYVPD